MRIIKDFPQQQEIGFSKLKNLEKQKHTKRSGELIEQLEDFFQFYIITEFDWEVILLMATKADAEKLEKILTDLVNKASVYYE